MDFNTLILSHLEARDRASALDSIVDPSERERTELTEALRRVSDTQEQLREIAMRSAESQAIVSENETSKPEAQVREYCDLADRFNVGNVFAATLEQRSTDGVEREIQTELGLNSNQIPLNALQRRAVTPAPDNAERITDPVIQPLFAASKAAYLGVAMPQVPSGERVYPALTTGASAATPAKDAAVTETTGQFTLTNIAPSRIQASFFFNREDTAAFGTMQDALAENLGNALMDKLDERVIAGVIAGGTATDQSGTAPITAAVYRKLMSDAVNGVEASSFNEMRWLIPNRMLESLISLTVTTAGATMYDEIVSRSADLMVSNHIPAVASKKQKAIIRLGNFADGAIAPIWSGVTLIPDEITKAANGQIVLTAIMLYAFTVLRATTYRIPEVQYAA